MIPLKDKTISISYRISLIVIDRVLRLQGTNYCQNIAKHFIPLNLGPKLNKMNRLKIRKNQPIELKVSKRE